MTATRRVDLLTSTRIRCRLLFNYLTNVITYHTVTFAFTFPNLLRNVFHQHVSSPSMRLSTSYSSYHLFYIHRRLRSKRYALCVAQLISASLLGATMCCVACCKSLHYFLHYYYSPSRRGTTQRTVPLHVWLFHRKPRKQTFKRLSSLLATTTAAMLNRLIYHVHNFLRSRHQVM